MNERSSWPLSRRVCPGLRRPDEDQAAPLHHRGDVQRGAAVPGAPDRSVSACAAE
jgi:hypothetical protein